LRIQVSDGADNVMGRGRGGPGITAKTRIGAGYLGGFLSHKSVAAVPSLAGENGGLVTMTQV